MIRVRWENGTEPRVLSSAAQVESASAEGDLTLEETGIVINMPLLTWPGGER